MNKIRDFARKFEFSKWNFALVAFFLILFVVGLAGAMSLVNETSTEIRVLVTEGSKVKTLNLRPNELISGLCKEGCVIALENGDELEIVGDEKISVVLP